MNHNDQFDCCTCVVFCFFLQMCVCMRCQKRKQMVEFASSEEKPGVSATWQANAVPMVSFYIVR